ncbi:urease accessory protein UreF [Tranquillimonas rosea]|uniref:urease accessory protein UreF n=1 Tax=Tranquillimonas rosea TaxID=641238 RepID=UPI003BAC440A
MRHADLLTLAQWLSPSFPVGGFAWSHGLESAIAANEVRGPDDLFAWLDGVLRHGSGRVDAVLLCAAMAPGADAVALHAEAEARAAGSERWAETLAQGGAFARTVSALGGEAVPELAMPVAVGVAARRLDLPPGLVAAKYLQAFAGNLVLASVRLIPLGQTDGQAVVARLSPVCEAVAQEAAVSRLEDVGGAAVLSDLAAMDHETKDVRLFRS